MARKPQAPSLMDRLRERIAAEPNPPPPLTQSKGSAAIIRNRRRLGLPDLPTDAERAEWAKRRK